MNKAIGMVVLGFSLLSTTVMAANLTIYAAGSLRSSLDDAIAQFAEKTGVRFTPTYGASGTLRANIEKGQVPDIFASASTEHTEALYQQGILKNHFVLAENSMCLLAAPGIHIERDNMLDVLLDPALRLGTSTPKLDPAGDYTWALFRKADTVRPGAFQQLDKKALQLIGKPVNPPAKQSTFLELLTTDRKADLFIEYCSYAAQAAQKAPGVTIAPFPPSLDVKSYYGIGSSTKADERAERFVQFMLGPEGKAILKKHGFN